MGGIASREALRHPSRPGLEVAAAGIHPNVRVRIERAACAMSAAHDIGNAHARERLVWAMDGLLAGFDASIMPTACIVAPWPAGWRIRAAAERRRRAAEVQRCWAGGRAKPGRWPGMGQQQSARAAAGCWPQGRLLAAAVRRPVVLRRLVRGSLSCADCSASVSPTATVRRRRPCAATHVCFLRSHTM